MPLFFGHRTAELLLDREFNSRPDASFSQELELCVANRQSIDNVKDELLAGIPAPYDILVDSRGKARRLKGVNCHVCRPDLPSSSFVELSGEVFVASPSLCFVLRAGECSLAQTVALGARLCGTFALDSRKRSGVRRRKPLVELSDLWDYVYRCPRMPGVARAKRALRLIPEGSASPMETVMQMVYCHPRRLNGLGIPRPQMNYRQTLSDIAKKLIDKDYIRIDMYWRDHMFGLEYQGKYAHASSTNIANDIGRQLAAERMGIELQFVTIEQLRNQAQRQRIAQKIADRLGLTLDLGSDVMLANQRLVDGILLEMGI